VSNARILSGKVHADALLAELEPLAKELNPTLTIVQVGDDEASATYIGKKIEAAAKIGIVATHLKLDADISLVSLVDEIESLNANPDVDGYIIQLPLPDQLWDSFDRIVAAIDPYKDVDGFTVENFGDMALHGEGEFLPPATAAGVVRLLEEEKIAIAGKHAVIVGRSNLVGKPLALMLLNRDATVTVCHSKTEDLGAITATADILVSAVGKPGLITADMVKKGAVVIDIGTTHVKGKLTGDVDFDAVSKKASAISPVPGGVGPLTVACLLANVVDAAEEAEMYAE
jgi:methylenetetrahydrofolate dehydrogenase (NADP+)/methenyltetrahydrofolate cyclohydrolase